MRALVRLYGVIVGWIELKGDKSEFSFARDYIDQRPRPILSRRYEDLTLTGLREVGIHSKLPAFWRNYLPAEGSALRRLLAKQSGVRETSEFRLLLALGDDLPGAVHVALDSAEDVQEIAELPLQSHPEAGLKFSLAGMQLKFSMVAQGERLTIPMRGQGGEWIVKFPDPNWAQVPELEAATLEWGRRSGLNVPEFRRVPIHTLDGIPAELQVDAEGTALAIQRYDRLVGQKRIQQEDFSQLLNCDPEDKYNNNGACPGGNYLNLGKIIRAFCGREDFAEYLRRLVFMVFSGNADAHLKNWSLYYPDPLRPRLTPAYDLVATVVYPGLDRHLALNFMKSRDFRSVTIDRFAALIEKVTEDVAERAVMIEVVQRAITATLSAWDSVAQQFSDAQRASIRAHIASLGLKSS